MLAHFFGILLHLCLTEMTREAALIYDTKNCRSTESEYLPRRSLAINELNARINEYLIIQKNSRFTEVALTTEYLAAIDFEIIPIPHNIPEQDFMELSKNLPCVKLVGFNEKRYTEEYTEVPYHDETELAATRSLGIFDHPRLQQSSVINDPLLAHQWGIRDGNQWSIKAEQALLFYGGKRDGVVKRPDKEVVIAIIDSGCQISHPDLASNVWRNEGETDCSDGIDNDGNGFIDDCNGWNFVDKNNRVDVLNGDSHGTSIAGIIGAATDNGRGIAGICPMCKIMCLKFMDRSQGTVIDEVRALDYAVANGARISNNSYGGYVQTPSKIEEEAINRAGQAGHLFVASAGNNNTDTDSADTMHTPSGYKSRNIVTVSSSTTDGRKSEFGNYGYRTVSVMAPGSSVLSTSATSYSYFSGTSFAAPHVAGVLGVILSYYPNLTVDLLVVSLIAACQKSPYITGFCRCGGVISLPTALSTAKALSSSADPFELMMHYHRINNLPAVGNPSLAATRRTPIYTLRTSRFA